jgi:hypothetical protein
MKRKEILNGFVALSAFLIIVVVASACNQKNEGMSSENITMVKSAINPVIPDNVLETDSLPVCVTDCLNSIPAEELSDAETEHLTYMREEEYLAKDVYVYLYGLYQIPVFNNISKAEQFHTSVIKVLLNKYDLEDPAENHEEGVFQNEDLQAVYDQLISFGSNSFADALTVGATIEDLDIFDLETCLSEVDNEDISLVFSSLMKGSRNHLRAFTNHLDFLEITYIPQYISQDEYAEIINSGWEIGNGICMYCTTSNQTINKITN